MGKFQIKASKNGGFIFNLLAGNGQVIASSQVYKSIETTKAGIASVQKNAPDAAIEDQTVKDFQPQKHPKFELYADKGGKIRFRLKATNGQIIATSEAYESMKSAQNGIASVQKNAPEAKIEQI
ncbi:MAG: YegP family protein [Victivallales bacterium]|nr:YegP family protein [Victivallales bacterium]